MRVGERGQITKPYYVNLQFQTDKILAPIALFRRQNLRIKGWRSRLSQSVRLLFCYEQLGQATQIRNKTGLQIYSQY